MKNEKEYKYKKYKKKYLQLKTITENGLGIGMYKKDKNLFKSLRTDSGKLFSFYERSIGDVTENELTKKIKANSNKILIIDSILLFDQFTNKYGKLNKDDVIYIQWDLVKRDYKGFYLNRSKELKLVRYSYAILNNHRHKSWWKHEYKYHDVMIFA